MTCPSPAVAVRPVGAGGLSLVVTEISAADGAFAVVVNGSQLYVVLIGCPGRLGRALLGLSTPRPLMGRCPTISFQLPPSVLYSYAVMALPLLAGAVQLSLNFALPGIAFRPVGAEGSARCDRRKPRRSSALTRAVAVFGGVGV